MAVTRQEAIATAKSHLQGASFGRSNVDADLEKSAVVDITEVQYDKGMRLQLPSTEAEWDEAVFNRNITIGGVDRKAQGMVLPVVVEKDGKFELTGESRVIYFSTLRKIAVPCDPATLKLSGRDTRRPKGSVYSTILSCGNMKEFLKKMMDEKSGKFIVVSDLEEKTVARNEYNKEAEKYVITGTRTTTVYDFDWA